MQCYGNISKKSVKNFQIVNKRTLILKTGIKKLTEEKMNVYIFMDSNENE